VLGRCVTKESPADDGSFLAPRWHFSIYGARWLNDRNCAKPVNSALTRERLQSLQSRLQHETVADTDLQKSVPVDW